MQEGNETAWKHQLLNPINHLVGQNIFDSVIQLLENRNLLVCNSWRSKPITKFLFQITHITYKNTIMPTKLQSQNRNAM